MTDAEIAESRGITVQQVENLRTLAKYLREKVDPQRFDMADYCYKGSIHNEVYLPSEHTCGTAACAVGHGPMAGIGGDLNQYKSWVSYTHVNFIPAGQDRSSEWLFSGCWDEHDNTPEGAADRIDTFLRSGVPLWFDADMYFGTINE